MVVRIPQELVLWFPWLLFLGEVVLVLTLGPKLIANARAKRFLPALSLANRIGRCFIGSVLAILAWMLLLLLAEAILPLFPIADHFVLQIVMICLWLALNSLVAILIASRICVGKIDKSLFLTGRYRFFNAPGLLILVCIWAFWAAFIPWLGGMLVIPSSASMGMIRYNLSQYQSEHGKYPNRLGQLVDAGFMKPQNFRLYGTNTQIEQSEKIDGQPYKAPKEFHYIYLPENAPGSLVQVWINPTIYKDDPSPVLFKSGQVKCLSPDVLCVELVKTYEWILYPDNRKTLENVPVTSTGRNDYVSIRLPESGAGTFLGNLFAVEVILVLSVGPILISRTRARNKLPEISLVQRIGACFVASVLAIIGWMIFMQFFRGVLSVSVENTSLPVIVLVLFPCIFLVVASGVTLLVAARLCASPVRTHENNPSRKRFFFAPGMLILVCIWAFWLIFFPYFSHFYSTLNGVIEKTRLHGVGTALELFAQAEGGYPDHLGRLVDKGYCSGKQFQLLGTPKECDVPEYIEGKPYKVSNDYLYIRLPEHAPESSIILCPSPVLYGGNPSPVLFKAGHVAELWPEEIAEEIGRTYEWLLARRKQKTD